MNRGIIRYGPPGADDDSINRQREALHQRYVLFPRLNAGPGSTTGYRMMTTPPEIEQLRHRDDIVWENQRTYPDNAAHPLGMAAPFPRWRVVRWLAVEGAY